MICRDAAEAISRSLDSSLPTVARIDLAVHTLSCGPCRRLRKQLLRLHADCAAASEEPPSGAGLTAAARERIAAALEGPPRG